MTDNPWPMANRLAVRKTLVSLLTVIPAVSVAPAQVAEKAFIDYFLPTPIEGVLVSDLWGAPGGLPSEPKNGLEDITMKKGCHWDGKIIVVPLDGAALDRDLHDAPVVAPPAASRAAGADDARGAVARKPLFRDPVFDGAADPVIVWDREAKRHVMFYTNRRANAPGLSGVAWVHGTHIGMAESRDGGATWTYAGVAAVPAEVGETLWAPDVVYHEGVYHMFVSAVPGVFEDWKHPRHIIHLTSRDLRTWGDPKAVIVGSDRVIDPCVYRMPDGSWRLWYNDERAGKAISLAESPDLEHWTDRGKVLGDRPGEGPKVFFWGGFYFMIVDEWAGLGVYRSTDATSWIHQDVNLLATPGTGVDDEVKGGHADVVVSGSRAYLFYFTHPGRRGEDEKKDTTEQRRSSIQVAELLLREGWLTCDRGPTRVKLKP